MSLYTAQADHLKGKTITLDGMEYPADRITRFEVDAYLRQVPDDDFHQTLEDEHGDGRGFVICATVCLGKSTTVTVSGEAAMAVHAQLCQLFDGIPEAKQ